jgi:DNA polymerase-1
MDFRVAGHYVNADALNRAYAKDPDADFHQMIADMTGLPRSPTPDQKGNAKQVNLGLLFGMGGGKLASEMGLPFNLASFEKNGKTFNYLKPGPEAMEIFDNYHGKFPEFKTMLDKASSIAKSRGFVKTILGRRLRFPGGNYTHKAGGLIFQGSAADALKLKIVEVHKFLKGTEGRLLLNVHDEIDSSVPKGDTKLDIGIGKIMEDFGPDSKIHFRVPIRSDSGMGPDWWVASK